jgi:hypothetical protein
LLYAGDLQEEEHHGTRFDLWNDLRVLVSAVFLYEGQESNAGKQVMMADGSIADAFINRGIDHVKQA